MSNKKDEARKDGAGVLKHDGLDEDLLNQDTGNNKDSANSKPEDEDSQSDFIKRIVKNEEDRKRQQEEAITEQRRKKEEHIQSLEDNPPSAQELLDLEKQSVEAILNFASPGYREWAKLLQGLEYAKAEDAGMYALESSIGVTSKIIALLNTKTSVAVNDMYSCMQGEFPGANAFARSIGNDLKELISITFNVQDHQVKLMEKMAKIKRSNEMVERGKATTKNILNLPRTDTDHGSKRNTASG